MLYALDPDKMGEVVWERRLGGGGAFMGGIMWGLATDGEASYVGVGDPNGPQANPGFYKVRNSDGELLWSYPRTGEHGPSGGTDRGDADPGRRVFGNLRRATAWRTIPRPAR